MPSTNNKVKFGLKNCHYAKATLDPDTNAVTFGTPVAIPGAVNLSLDPEGDTEPFYADDMVYQIKGLHKGFNALKYVNIYHRAKNLREGAEHEQFLGL